MEALMIKANKWRMVLLLITGMSTLIVQICSIVLCLVADIQPSKEKTSLGAMIDYYFKYSISSADMTVVLFVVSYIGSFTFFGVFWWMTSPEPNEKQQDLTVDGATS